MASRRAVIDIGTNSVKLLVGDVSGDGVTPVFEGSHQTRLGQGFYQTHVLQPEALEATARAVADFAAKARELGAASLMAVATSAVRDARNSEELLEALRNFSGVEPRIISGKEEADYAYRGVLSDPKYRGMALLLLDMGGGSTEFIVGKAEERIFQHSYPLGTLRLMHRLHISDPPLKTELEACLADARTFLRNEIVPSLEEVLPKAGPRHEISLLGTGGTSTILARMEAGIDHYDREAMESLSISIESLRARTEQLWRLPLEERKHVRGLPEKRADVILTGAAAYLVIMEELGFKHLRVSTRGLRFALLLENGHCRP